MRDHDTFLNLAERDFKLVAIPRPIAKGGGKWTSEDQELLMDLKEK
jgi:hypothetical protein